MRNKTCSSCLHMMGLELKRGLSEKRFWLALGAVLCCLILECVAISLFSITVFYFGGEAIDLFGHVTITRNSLFRIGLSSTLFVSFFPFFAVLAYGHSKIDDRKNRFDMQLIVRTGFFKYFVSKTAATSILGGLFCGSIPFLFAVLIDFFYDKNIFLQDVVVHYKKIAETENDAADVICFYQQELVRIKGYWPKVFYVTLMLFLTGFVFAFLGFVVSLFIENKILFYAFPVLFLVWESYFITGKGILEMQIEMHNVGKIVKGTALLTDISLHMESGKAYGFVGDNGSGKTVLFKVLMGLMKKTQGNILINGEEHTDLLQDVGFIIERPNFIPYYSALKNLKIVAACRGIVDENRLKEVLQQVGLEPDDKKKVGKYSLGMKQKLAIAMAIMEHPSVLILDEPLNALDENAVSQARKLIMDEKERGALILIASHYAADIDYLCNEVYRMCAGKIIKNAE